MWLSEMRETLAILAGSVLESSAIGTSVRASASGWYVVPSGNFDVCMVSRISAADKVTIFGTIHALGIACMFS